MDELSEARSEIDQIDRELMELFKRRMAECAKIARYKSERGLPIFNGEREKQILSDAASSFNNTELAPYYLSFLEDLMRISKRYQTNLTSGMQIAFSGVGGAFADIATKRIFPRNERVGFADFEQAYRAVENGECGCAVLPIENSYAGTVGSVMDLIFEGDLYVNGMYTLPVSQNLLGLPGSSIEGIRTVVSHPQALEQCASFIKKHGFTTQIAENTALAAKAVSEGKDPAIAAIASRDTAGIYGLSVLDHDINESAGNTTRFAVVSKAPVKGRKNGKFILMFTVNDVAGALAAAINVISKYGFNMKSLKSRPVKNKAWQYYFYVEAEGDETTNEGKAMLRELSLQCEKLKIAGHFGEDVSLKEGDSK